MVPQSTDVPSKLGAEEIEELRSHWVWFLALGIGLTLLGVAAIVYAFAATIASAVVFGVFLLAAGIAHVISAFSAPRWQGFLLSLLVGILYGVAGFLVLDRPDLAAAGLTLLLASMFIVLGIFRIVSAVQLRFHQWGVTLFSGIVTVLLGALIWAGWPETSFFVIGLFIGIELLGDGIATSVFALALRRLPEPLAESD